MFDFLSGSAAAFLNDSHSDSQILLLLCKLFFFIFLEESFMFMVT
jgi:hypothetical protein